jgi:hypothetical protein
MSKTKAAAPTETDPLAPDAPVPDAPTTDVTDGETDRAMLTREVARLVGENDDLRGRLNDATEAADERLAQLADIAAALDILGAPTRPNDDAPTYSLAGRTYALAGKVRDDTAAILDRLLDDADVDADDQDGADALLRKLRRLERKVERLASENSVAKSALLDQALASPIIVHACYRAVAAGKVVLVAPWVRRGNGPGVYIRPSAIDAETQLGTVAHTESRGGVDLFSAAVGGTHAPKDAPLAEAQAWVDGVLRARGAHVVAG